MSFVPLPVGDNAAETVRRLRAIDAEIFGSIFARAGTLGDLDVTGNLNITGNLDVTGDISMVGDFYSSNWVSGGGSLPLSLPDGSATVGFALDGSAGTAQFQSMYAEGGTLGDLEITGALTLTDASASMQIGASTGSQMWLNDSGVEWRDVFASPLEAPDSNWPFITTSVDGDTLGSFPADTNMYLTIRGAQWSGNDAAWLRFWGDNWASSQPAVSIGTGAYSNTQFAVGASGIYTYTNVYLDENSYFYQEMDGGLGRFGDYSYGYTDLGGGDYSVIKARNAADKGPGSFPVFETVEINWDESATTMTVPSMTYGTVGTDLLLLDDVTVYGDLTLGGQLSFTGTSAQINVPNGVNSHLFIDNEHRDVSDIGNDIYMRTWYASDLRNRYRIDANGFHYWYDRGGTVRCAIDNSGNFRIQDGTVGAPGLSFYDEGDVGIYRPTTSQIAIGINSVQEFLLGTSGWFVPNAYSSVISGSTRDMYVKSDGQIGYISSRRETKQNIVPLDASDIELKPVTFEYKDGGVPDMGFIVEDLAEQHPLLAVYEDGVPVSYNTRPMLAVLAAKVARLEEQMKGCTCA